MFPITASSPPMRLLLLKSSKFANQPGYYLLNGRWHSIKQDKPAPKGAPVSAHPHAAGAPVKKETLADHEWEQLKLPAENVNAGTFNKQLDQLKAAASAGDVTGIVASGYGTNTYGKKLAIIANHVLGLLGSEHKVAPGQKAGAHAAVQTAPQIEAAAPAPVAAKQDSQPASSAKGLTAHQKTVVAGIEHYLGLDLAGSASYVKNNVVNIEIGSLKQHNLHAIENYGTQFGHFKVKPGGHQKISLILSKKAAADDKAAPKIAAPAPQQEKPAAAPAKKADADLAVPEFAEGKQTTGVKAHYEKVAKKIIAAAKVGDLSALQFMPNPAKGNTWKGKTDNSKKLLQLHQSAIAHAQAQKEPGKEIQHPDAEKMAKQEAKELAKEHVTPEPKQEPKPELKPKKDAEPKFTDKGTLANPSGYGKTFANLKQANAAAEKLKAQGHDVYVTASHPYLVKLNKPEQKQDTKPAAEAGPKEGETKQGADGTLVFKDGRWHKQAEAAKAEQKPGAKEQPKGDAASKLAQIPWDNLLLPDSNKNAKSHNKQVAKIKAMAEAGDIAGLEAFKAGVNTYGKKQNLLAQTALAALKESAPATAPAAEANPAPAPAAAPPADDGIPKPPKIDNFNQAQVAKIWVKMAQDGKSTELMNSISTLSKNAAKTPHAFADKDGTALLKFAAEMGNWAANNMAEPEDDDEPEEKSSGKPIKPKLEGTLGVIADQVEEAIDDDDKYGIIKDTVEQMEGHTSAGSKELLKYAKAALDYLAGDSSDNDGPHEGDTKQGADGMLVFKNGRWHKQSEEKAADKPAPAGPAEVEIPTFDGPNATHNEWLKKAAEALKGKVVAEGKDGLKQPVTNHKDGSVTVNIAGVKVAKASLASKNPAVAKFAQFVDELKASVGKAKKAKPAPKAAQAPAPAAEPEQPKQIESMDHWTQTGGQGGSNPGGKFKDEHGVEWYCKFPESEDVAKSEVLAAKLYGALGLNAQDAKLITKDGKVGIASRWQEVKKVSPKELAKTPGVLAGFAADAWLANWDVVGMGYDNLQVDDKGEAMRVDAGGSLMYRAQGGKKAFGDVVTELDSLRDPKLNPQAAAVFGKMTKADISASVAKVVQISDAQIRILVNANGPGTKAERKALADTLIARKNDLIAKYPKAAKQPKKRLDPTSLPVKEDRLPKRHDFANWNGKGAGLSGAAHVNEANQTVEDEMLALAKTGNLTKLKDFKFQPVDKATGKPSGEPKPISQHPSKHVQQYHADLVQALDEIANPPQPLKIFQESDVNTLEELEAAFPPKKFGTTVAAVHSNEKLGFWVVLGGVHGATKFIPKKVSNFTTEAIKSAYTKFKEASKLAKHFVHSVQASGSYNDLFRDGKEKDHQGNLLSDVAKAALEFATEQPEGTSLYRWQNMSDDMVKKIMSAPDGSVFQATGPMCTSYSPTATSHFGKHRVTIRYAKGAKAVESFGSGGFAGEKEITTLPNSRFVILKKEMVPDDKKGGKQRMELEVLMLPPDLGV